MSPVGLPLPQPDPCLITSRKSTCKGGTLIDETVWTLEEHKRRVVDGTYRPEACPTCGCRKVHVHDYVERHPFGLVLVSVVRVVRFICASRACRATWRLLPAFLARHLWWGWEPVEAALLPPTKDPARVPAAQPARPVPARTQRRWRARLSCSARHLVALLASRGVRRVQAVAQAAGLMADRWSLVAAYDKIVGAHVSVHEPRAHQRPQHTELPKGDLPPALVVHALKLRKCHGRKRWDRIQATGCPTSFRYLPTAT